MERWYGLLQEEFVSFESFKAHCRVLHVHVRLGYDTAEKAWADNPMLTGYTLDSYFKITTIEA